MASSDTRTFVIGAVALAAVAGVFVWALIGPPEPEAEPPLPAAPSPPPAAAAPEPGSQDKHELARAKYAERKAAKAAERREERAGAEVDLFAGPMPEWMENLYDRTTRKKWLHVSQQKQLHDYGQQHEDDARPQLLLAWDSMNRGWEGFATRLYRMAYEADERAKHDPTMLRDLIDIASRFERVEFRETAELVKEAYGTEALPKIDLKLAELRQQGHLQHAARLQRLRDKITGE
jgi:hypothetical protein